MDAGIVSAGFGVGALVGMTGVGGGALMTPLLIFVFGVSPLVAVGTDLIFAAVTKASGVCVHARQGSVDWRLVRRLATGSLPAALLTLALLQEVDSHSAQAQAWVSQILGIALMLTAAALFWRLWRARHPRQVRAEHRYTAAATVATGVLLGGLVTLTSVGAGALGAAVLFWLYPRHSALRVVGSDLAHAVPLTALAGLGHWQLGTVDGGLLLALLLGSLPGIYLGSRLAAHLPERWLRPALASLLLLIGLRMVA